MIAWFSRISNDLAKRTALSLPAPAPDTSYYHNNKTSGVSTYGTPLPTIKTLAVAILAKGYSQSSLSQAATIATGLKSEGAVPRILGQLLTPGVDATYSTSHAAPFDGIIAADGTDGLFWKASLATLYPIAVVGAAASCSQGCRGGREARRYPRRPQ